MLRPYFSSVYISLFVPLLLVKSAGDDIKSLLYNLVDNHKDYFHSMQDVVEN